MSLGGSLASTTTDVTNLVQQLQAFQNQFSNISLLPQGSLSVTGSVYGNGNVLGSVYGNGSVTGSVYGPGATQPTYPAAPPSFPGYLQSLMASLRNISAEVPMAGGPATLASLNEFTAALGDLSPSNENQLYFYLSQVSGWQQWPSMLSSALTGVQSSDPGLSAEFASWIKTSAPEFAPFVGGLPSGGSTGGSTGTTVTPGSSSSSVSTTTLGGSLGSTFPSQGSVTTTTTTESTDAFPPLPLDTCPPIIPYPGMIVLEHALVLVEAGATKGAKLAERDDTWGAVAIGEGVIITIPGIIHDILTAVAFVAQAADLGATILDQLHSVCETGAHNKLLQTLYKNLSKSQGEVITNTNTIITDVIALTTILNARTSTILQNIGYLRQQLTKQVHTILNSQAALITAVNSLTLQNLRNQKTQTLVNNRTLEIDIENSLSQPMEENTALFELPASAGGYLDATPVGVQSVVTNLLTSMAQSGATVAPQALLVVGLGDRAIALKKYKLAYTLFKIGYQVLQYIGPFNPPAGASFGLPTGSYPNWPFGPGPNGGLAPKNG